MRKGKKIKGNGRKKGENQSSRVELDDEQRRSVDNKNEFTLLKLIVLVCLFINILIANLKNLNRVRDRQREERKRE